MRAKGKRMEAKPRPDQRRLDTAVLTDAGGFASLEGEWAELYEGCPKATPFQSWAWLYSWWEHYGEGRELRVVVARDADGRPAGALPLMLERRLGLGRLLFVGSGASDYLDMLAREGWEEAVAEACAAALEGMGGWWVADLQELRPGAIAWTLDGVWSGPKVRLWQSNCPLTDVKPWNEMLMSLKNNRRSSVRQALRRAEEDGLRRGMVAAENAEYAARRLVALHRESWQGRGIGVEHTTRRFEAFVETAARRITERGLGAISEYRRDGQAVVSQFLIFGRDFVGGYMLGASQEAAKRYQFSSLCIWDAANVAYDKDLSCLHHLRGEEPYKTRWSSRVVPNHRLVLGRNPMVLAAYNAWQALRSKLETYAGSEDAPSWIGEAVVRYRDLRTRAFQHAERISR